MKATPYIQHPDTGESKTKEFLLAFFEAYTSPNEADRSIYDTIYGDMPVVQEVLYTRTRRKGKRKWTCPICPSKDECQHLQDERLIGQAPHISSGKNRNERLWCTRIDIRNACLLLTEQQRTVLGRKYIADEQDETISNMLGVSPSTVLRIANKAINDLVATLDRTPRM